MRAVRLSRRRLPAGEEIAGEWDNWRSIDEAAMNEDYADSTASEPKGVI